jgi:energy-coupling factor transport system permease protein
MALESKGFGYSSTRSNYLELKFTWKDLAICLFGMGVLAAVAYVQFNAAAFGILISIFPWADYS